MKYPIYFPIVVEFTGSNGLEDSAQEGVDFYRYEICFSILDLPINKEFKILGSINTFNIKEVVG